MKDFNFFELYLDIKGISSYNNLVLYITISIITLGLVIWPLINIFRIDSLKKDIAVMKTNLESETVCGRLNIIEQKNEKVYEMEKNLSLLESIDEVIKKRDVVSDLLLKKITDKTPKDVFFRLLNFSPGQVQMQGAATNSLAIAHLKDNLKSDKDFKDIYISNISLDEGLYNFSINFALESAEKDSIGQDNIE